MDKSSPRVPNLEKAAEIAEALGWELYLGPKREIAKLDIETADLPPDGFSMIRRADVRASAGSGLHVVDEAPMEPVAFRTDWLIRKGIRPSEAVIIEARGDSMEPRISDGDLVLVDTSKTTLQPVHSNSMSHMTKVWVIRKGEELFIKRVAWHPTEQLLYLVSDNVTFGNSIYMGEQIEDITVVGEAVWWAHTTRP